VLEPVKQSGKVIGVVKDSIDTERFATLPHLSYGVAAHNL
jgi:hypothetical protein